VDTLIYDAHCDFCKSWVDWALKRNAGEHLEFIGCQSEERKKRFPHINETDCEKAMYVVLSDGRTYSGGDALPFFLTAIPGWRWTRFLFKIPGALFISRAIYRWIARNRSRFKTCGNKVNY
jgi:predicted DCC family thiol-disulfide oxidoreductase YuxK